MSRSVVNRCMIDLGERYENLLWEGQGLDVYKLYLVVEREKLNPSESVILLTSLA